VTEPRKKTGRPSKRTPEVKQMILEALRGGNYLETAAAYAGVHRSTLNRWMNEDDPEFQDFRDAVEKARADAIVRNVGVVLAAAPKNWQAAAWWLERTNPDKYGRRVVELGGKVDLGLNEGLQVTLSFDPRPVG
jgi:hypothetical protein